MRQVCDLKGQSLAAHSGKEKVLKLTTAMWGEDEDVPSLDLKGQFLAALSGQQWGEKDHAYRMKMCQVCDLKGQSLAALSGQDEVLKSATAAWGEDEDV